MCGCDWCKGQAEHPSWECCPNCTADIKAIVMASEGGQNARRAPFSYTVDPEDPIRWQRVLGEAFGYVSMCWDVTPQGEFDSTNAADAMRKVEAFLMDVM